MTASAGLLCLASFASLPLPSCAHTLVPEQARSGHCKLCYRDCSAAARGRSRPRWVQRQRQGHPLAQRKVESPPGRAGTATECLHSDASCVMDLNTYVSVGSEAASGDARRTRPRARRREPPARGHGHVGTEAQHTPRPLAPLPLLRGLQWPCLLRNAFSRSFRCRCPCPPPPELGINGCAPRPGPSPSASCSSSRRPVQSSMRHQR